MLEHEGDRVKRRLSRVAGAGAGRAEGGLALVRGRAGGGSRA